jgi:G:T/U-mismatch repair DNA glycosylase
MQAVKHRFLHHQLSSNTETLIIGTFNPDAEGNQADFFYGRNRNYLWKLLPIAFQEEDLKGSLKEEKMRFINKHKIDLIDLISEIKVDDGQEVNYFDGYIDDKISIWRDIIFEIGRLKNLKRVCFTRRTFSDIPNIRLKVQEIEAYCNKINVYFQALSTPARFYHLDKQNEWTNFLTDECISKSINNVY